MATQYRVELERSDLGDGGWSLHAHRLDVTTDDDYQAEFPLLVSGEAEQRASGWSRPNADDYAAAQARASELAARYEIEAD